MSDSSMKGRVKGLLAAPADGDTPPAEGAPYGGVEQEALQVLTLAQRTAEEHLTSARQEADRICSQARDQAAQIVRDAQERGEAFGREAEASLSEAREAAARIASEAQARAERAQQEAEEILSDAQIRADELIKIAQAKADELQHLAEQRYDDVVGSLAAKREALQQQIEALEQFDRDYRARLQAFMQGQLRALWMDEPRVDDDGGVPPEAESAPVPGQRAAIDEATDHATAPPAEAATGQVDAAATGQHAVTG